MDGLDAAYAETKAALLTFLARQEPAPWQRPVPATPEWTVLDVVAHVTGLAADAANDALPTDLNLLEQFRDDQVIAVRDAVAQSQVDRRRGAGPSDVCAEWDAVEPVLLPKLAAVSGQPGGLQFGMDLVLVTDVCVHTDDVLLALGAAPLRNSAASRFALAGYGFGVAYRLQAVGLPPLALNYGGKERVLGEGAPVATVTADRWELLRVLAGRRSRAQIAALEWSGDPDPYLALLPAYGERADDLIEDPSGRP